MNFFQIMPQQTPVISIIQTDLAIMFGTAAELIVIGS
jgi:hypothetical protein